MYVCVRVGARVRVRVRVCVRVCARVSACVCVCYVSMYVCSSFTETLYLQQPRSEYFLRRRICNFQHSDLIILASLGVLTPRRNEARHVVCLCGQVVILYHRTDQISPTVSMFTIVLAFTEQMYTAVRIT